ncbi:MAG: hypothetical protein H7A35_06950 [Planctomycetales bacterium]|nr:hypothetical protein [bacterium]UNM09790.1 MAG: hypothetical protein H7A35_06950 [Planctomycetales bacterium]
MNMSPSLLHRIKPAILVGLAILLCAACTRNNVEADGSVDTTDAVSAVDSGQQAEYLDVGFATVYSWSAVGPARNVRITGRLHRCDGSEQWLPQSAGAPQPGDYVLYRYVVDCCPGHSVPAVIALGTLPDDTGSLQQDRWVELTGQLRLSIEPGGLPLLDPDSLLDAKAPDEPLEQLNPPSKMGAACAGSRPDVPYPPR